MFAFCFFPPKCWSKLADADASHIFQWSDFIVTVIHIHHDYFDSECLGCVSLSALLVVLQAISAWDSLLSCSTFIFAALQVIFSVSLNLSCICFSLSLQSWSQTSPPNRLSKGGLGVRINQRHPGRKMNIPHFSCGKLSLPLRSGGCLRRLRNSNSCLIPGGAKPPYCPVCSSSQGASEFFLCFKQLTMFSWSDFDSDRAIYVQKKNSRVAQRAFASSLCSGLTLTSTCIHSVIYISAESKY